ncbi:Helicase SKI2W [Hordeum vulgare]|nr:Helicase SKI2W [Hordeum vulgare]
MADPFVYGGTVDPFMQVQDGMGTFPTDHEFPKDYGLGEEDEVEIDGAPLFEEELSNKAQATNKRQSRRSKAYTKDEDKRQSKRSKAYTKDEDNLLCECWRDIGQDPKIGSSKSHIPFGFVSIVNFMNTRSFRPTKVRTSVGGCPSQSVGG